MPGLCSLIVTAVASPVENEETVIPAITLSEKALGHLIKMRSELNKDLLLRIGVRQGGCSGYSYVMDFEDRSKIAEGDSIIEHDGFAMGKPICILLRMSPLSLQQVAIASTCFSVWHMFCWLERRGLEFVTA